MRLTSIELHPAASTSVCEFSFRDPGAENPYNIKKITGLDADEIQPIYLGQLQSAAGVKFYDMDLRKRDIVFRISLNPRVSENETYSSLRDDVYRTIASSRTGVIEVQFKNGDDVVAVTSGSVTKIETEHFDADPEVVITISCRNTTLISPTPTVVDVSSADSYEFTVVDDVSTAPHGFEFGIKLLTNASEMTLEESVGTEVVSYVLRPVDPFLAGDVINISSIRGNRYVYIYRGGVTIPIAESVMHGSVWPILFPGETTFALKNPPVNPNSPFSPFEWDSLVHYRTYWGV